MSSFQQDLRHGFIARNGAIGWLIVVNVAVYVGLGVVAFVLFLGGGQAAFTRLMQKLMLPGDLGIFLTQPWTLVSHGFLHSYGGLRDILHIAFNMLWLYWLGRIYREYLGDRVVYSTFLLGILAGAFVYLLAYNLAPGLQTRAAFTYALGASAGVNAIIVGTATLLPNFRVMLFLFGAVQLKWLALIIVLLDFLTVPFGAAGSGLAHLGGAALGFLFITYRRKGVDLSKPFTAAYDGIAGLFKPRPRRPKHMKAQRGGLAGGGVRTVTPRNVAASDQDEIDRILDKIKAKGYDGLTKAEKQKLFEASQQD